MKKKCVRQIDEKDCGVACLATIFKHYNTEIPISKIRDMSGTDINGTSALGLKKASEEIGFNCLVAETDMTILKEKKIQYPLIAHVLIDNSYFHYIVIHKIKRNKLIIADPAKGVINLTISEFNKIWTGVILLITPSANYVPTREEIPSLFSFFSVLFEQKNLLFNIILASIFIAMFGILTSYYFQGLIDFFIPNKAKETLFIISVGLIIVSIFQIIFEYIRNYLLLIWAQKLSINIILKYFNHILKLPLGFFYTRKTGEIISRFLDANKIIAALTNVSLSMFLDLGMIIFIGITLFIQNSTLFLITLLTIPFYLISIFSFIKIYNKSSENEMEEGANLNSSIVESLNGIETIKAYNNEEKIYEKIDKQFIKYLKKSFKSTNIDNLQQIIKQSIQLFSSIFILWAGSYLVMDGKITLGQLITYNSLLVFFSNPLQNIINLQITIQSAQVANKRLNEIFYIKAEESDEKTSLLELKQNLINEITLNDVTFSYNVNSTILKGVSMRIKKNSKVAIVGVSGSGKSTLAKLLVKFYSPNRGNIFFDNINIKDISAQSIRQHITYVPQESFFLHGTIVENLTFGLAEKKDLQDIMNVCEIVDMMQYIDSQPLRFDTIIEEGASNLSGGQKQRLAIARALLQESEILIFDEATSGIDRLMEKKIVDKLISCSSKTIIFIAHQLSIAQKCDDIFVLHDNFIIEKGNHQNLINNKGMYSKLWKV